MNGEEVKFHSITRNFKIQGFYPLRYSAGCSYGKKPLWNPWSRNMAGLPMVFSAEPPFRSPKGAQYASPGQRPGFHGPNHFRACPKFWSFALVVYYQ